MQECEAEAPRRAFTRDELQTFFDCADDQVERVRGRGRKGWLPAFRDAMLFKTAYAVGLRRNETRMLDTADFGRNPEGAEFGEFGICYVRHGKAKKGSPPKRRSVLTVWEWSAEILDQWTSEVRPAMRHADGPALWPSERGRRVGLQRLDSRFATYRDDLGLDPVLDFRSLRRSYVTHLIEDGMDPLFVQQQAGHDHASTTSIYTCVSSDFRTRTLRRALDATIEAALKTALRARREIVVRQAARLVGQLTRESARIRTEATRRVVESTQDKAIRYARSIHQHSGYGGSLPAPRLALAGLDLALGQATRWADGGLEPGTTYGDDDTGLAVVA